KTQCGRADLGRDCFPDQNDVSFTQQSELQRNSEREKSNMLISTRTYAMGFVVAMLLVCFANAAERNPQGTENSTTNVGVKTESGVCQWAGTRWYGKTKKGACMEQREAQQRGYRPAGGNTCDSDSIPSATQSDTVRASGVQCGFERWPVKILKDKDRDLV